MNSTLSDFTDRRAGSETAYEAERQGGLLRRLQLFIVRRQANAMLRRALRAHPPRPRVATLTPPAPGHRPAAGFQGVGCAVASYGRCSRARSASASARQKHSST